MILAPYTRVPQMSWIFRREVSELVVGENEPFHIQRLGPEVEQQSDFQSGGLEIVQELGLFNSRDSRKGLDLYNQCVVTDEVGAVFGFQPLMFVGDWQIDFSAERDSPFLQLNGHRLLVDSLEESTSQLAVNVHRRANDCVRSWIAFGHQVCFRGEFISADVTDYAEEWCGGEQYSGHDYSECVFTVMVPYRWTVISHICVICEICG